MKITTQTLKTMLTVGTMALLLWGCAAQVQAPPSAIQAPAPTTTLTQASAYRSEARNDQGRAFGQAPFPGNYPSYAWGTAQLKENFENVEVAQWVPGLFREMRTWRMIEPSTIHTSQIFGLGHYLPFSVRWKLKDGREFILENIDTAGVMRDYFKSHTIQLPWQKEGRERFAQGGDYVALLAHEVKNDHVILKWIITTNHTAPKDRFLANGGATKCDTSQVELIVTSIPGSITSSIDFNNRMEFPK